MGEEATLLSDVRRHARDHGWVSYHTFRSDRSDPGFPDLVLIRGDRILFRELKAPRKYLTPEQSRWAEIITAAGGDFAVWRPIDWASGTVQADLAKGEPARPLSESTQRRVRADQIRRHKKRLAARGENLAPRLPI